MAVQAWGRTSVVLKMLSADLLTVDEEDELLQFSGPPAALRGVMTVRNPSERRLMLSRIHGFDVTVRGGPGAEGVTMARIGRATVLAAGEARQVPVTLALDPHTPPGQYHVELEVAGQRRRAAVTVVEEINFDAQPTEFVVENRPKATQDKLLVVSNRGNVPVNIRDIGAVPLDDELLTCRSLRGALREWTSRQENNVESYLVEVGRQANRALEDAGILRVHIADSPLAVAPGEQRTLSLSIEVPSTLDQHTRYTGVAPFYLTDLTFVVVPAASSLAENSSGGGNE